jgi:hypothetical protein
MICEVCGMEYGLSHNCAGPRSDAAQQLAIAELTPPENAGMAYYLKQAWKIARWDDVAIRRNSKDSKATIFGLLFMLASAYLILIVLAYVGMRLQPANSWHSVRASAMIVRITFGAIIMIAISIFQVGLCHLIAKLIFGATGKFVEVARPLLLGWFVNCLILIPVAGIPLAGLGWAAVMMMVFEEVDGIKPLQAFGISAGINLCFLALQIALMPNRHHL